MGNATTVAVKDKRDIWYIPDPTTENNHPEQLAHSLVLVCFLPLPLIMFTVSASERL